MPRNHRNHPRDPGLPEIEPDEPSEVRGLPGLDDVVPTGGFVPPPPPFKGASAPPTAGPGRPSGPEGSEEAPGGRSSAYSPAVSPSGGDLAAARLAAKLSEAVDAEADPSLVDLAGDRADEGPVRAPPQPRGTDPAAPPRAPVQGVGGTSETTRPDGGAQAPLSGGLELDYEKAGLLPGTRGHAAPDDSAPRPSSAAAAGPQGDTVSSQPSSHASLRSPAARPSPMRRVGAVLVTDPVARGLAAAGLGLLLAAGVAQVAAQRTARRRIEPLLEELATSAARPLAARAGTLRSLPAIQEDIDAERTALRMRSLGIAGLLGLALGAAIYVGIGRVLTGAPPRA